MKLYRILKNNEKLIPQSQYKNIFMKNYITDLESIKTLLDKTNLRIFLFSKTFKFLARLALEIEHILNLIFGFLLFPIFIEFLGLTFFSKEKVTAYSLWQNNYKKQNYLYTN
jgi:hypothetical protein